MKAGWLVAGASAQIAGQTIANLDANKTGTDDKLAFALTKTGVGIAAYASGELKGAASALRLSGQTLLDLADEMDAGKVDAPK